MTDIDQVSKFKLRFVDLHAKHDDEISSLKRDVIEAIKQESDPEKKQQLSLFFDMLHNVIVSENREVDEILKPYVSKCRLVT